MGAFEAVISIVGVWVGGNHTFKVSKKQGQGVGFPMLLSSHPIPLPKRCRFNTLPKAELSVASSSVFAVFA